MKLFQVLGFCLLACTICAFDVDDSLDRLDSALTVAAFQDNLRARLSGTIDLEAYHLQQPAPGLIDSKIDNLFNPRLTLFLDAQLGGQICFFAQSRIDRGFDPSDRGAQSRLDEYALLPLRRGKTSRFSVSLKQIRHRRRQLDSAAFIVGKSVRFSPARLKRHRRQRQRGAGVTDRFCEQIRPRKIPIQFRDLGPSYASGISVSGPIGQFDYAAEIKNASVSSRPSSWNINETGFDQQA